GFARMKRRQPPFELDVRLVRAADEAHRARTRAIALCRFLLRSDDVEVKRHAEVGVRVHADEVATAFARETKPRAASLTRAYHFRDDRLRALRGAPLDQIRNMSLEYACKPVERHCQFLSLPALAPNVSLSMTARRPAVSSATPSFAFRCFSMSVVIARRSYSWRQPHSSRAAVSSMRRGHD